MCQRPDQFHALVPKLFGFWFSCLPCDGVCFLTVGWRPVACPSKLYLSVCCLFPILKDRCHVGERVLVAATVMLYNTEQQLSSRSVSTSRYLLLDSEQLSVVSASTNAASWWPIFFHRRACASTASTLPAPSTSVGKP